MPTTPLFALDTIPFDTLLTLCAIGGPMAVLVIAALSCMHR